MKRLSLLCLFYALNPAWHLAASGPGTEAASFLDIPVGAEPAALGSAYTARAENAYATIWNPAGLARVETPELSAMYLSYLVDTSYQEASVAIPWKRGDMPSGFGVSIQTLGARDIDGRDETGSKTANFSSRFSAYSFGFGQAISERLSMGTAVKVIQEKIADASSSAYGLDGGILFNASRSLTLGAAIANLGTKVKLASQSDPLPLQMRGGAAWRISPAIQLSGEVVYRRTGLLTEHLGAEWSPSRAYALRVGYQTHHTRELGAMAGLTTGLGMRWKGQELSYAFVPFGELGSTHYLSVVLRWSTEPRADRVYPNRFQASEDEEINFSDNPASDKPSSGYSDYRNLYDILSDDERKSLKKSAPEKDKDFQ